MQVNHTNLYLQVTPERPKHGPKGFKKVFVHQVTSPFIKGTVVKKSMSIFFLLQNPEVTFAGKPQLKIVIFHIEKKRISPSAGQQVIPPVWIDNSFQVSQDNILNCF